MSDACIHVFLALIGAFFGERSARRRALSRNPMPLRLLFLVLASVGALLLLPARAAHAQPPAAPAVYVVDVSGDRLDAARLRAAVARELSVTAVAPEDPRAEAAAGTIEVTADATAKTLRVAFRKPATPVTRTVALPDDPTRAEVAAVFLAGNLARDEASELLGSLKKTAAAPGAEERAASAAVREAELLDREELRRLRIALQANVDATRRRSRAVTAGAAAFGALTLTAGVTLLVDDRSPGERRAGNFLIGVGGAGVGVALGEVLDSNWHPSFGKWPDETLRDKVTAIVAEGGSSSEVLDRIDEAWRAQAAEARSSRHFGAVLTLVLGTAAMGIGGAIELGTPRDSGDHSGTSLLYGVGALEVGIGIYGLLAESPFEESYRTWHAARRPAPASVRPSIGFAPLPGGGAVSAGFTF